MDTVTGGGRPPHDAHLDGVLFGAFHRQHAAGHLNADRVGVQYPVPERGSPHRGLHLDAVLHPRRRRGRLHLVREVHRGRGVVGADVDHGQHGAAAVVRLGTEVEERAVLVGAEEGARRARAGADVNRLAVAHADDGPAVDRRDVALERVRRPAGEVAAPVDGAEDRRVVAGPLVGLHLVTREEGRAAVVVVPAREQDGFEPAGDGAAPSVVRRAAPAAPVVALAIRLVGASVADSAGDVPVDALQINVRVGDGSSRKRSVRQDCMRTSIEKETDGEGLMGHLVDGRGEQLEAMCALEKIVGAVNAQVEVFFGWRRHGALAVTVVAWRPRPAAAQPVLALFAAGSAPASAAPGRGGSTSGAAAAAIWRRGTSTTYGAWAAALSPTNGARAAALYLVIEVAAPTPTAGAAAAAAALLIRVTQRKVGGRSAIALRLPTPGPVGGGCGRGGRRSPARGDRTPVLVLAAATHLAIGVSSGLKAGRADAVYVLVERLIWFGRKSRRRRRNDFIAGFPGRSGWR